MKIASIFYKDMSDRAIWVTSHCEIGLGAVIVLLEWFNFTLLLYQTCVQRRILPLEVCFLFIYKLGFLGV